jgi:hypothetical protein
MLVLLESFNIVEKIPEESDLLHIYVREELIKGALNLRIL